MPETTTRKTGLYGTVTFGASANGGTDIHAGGEIRNWSLSIDIVDDDLRALDDFDFVGAPIGRTLTFECEKLVISPTLIQRLAVSARDSLVAYVTLYTGRAQTVTTGNGAVVATGMVYFTRGQFQNPRGAVLENISGKFTGAAASAVS